MKIFVPQDSTYNKCYVVQSEGVIRGYDKSPQYSTNYTYRDYYINSDYIYRDGQGTWSTYSTLPICLESSIITNDIYYRRDLSDILTVFLIMSIFIFYIPIKVFLRLFRRLQ